jgi:branched-chain amino acid transport system permease protein
MMDWKETLEDFWEDVKDQIYKIIMVSILIFIPFVIGAPGFEKLPIISNIYEIGREAGLFATNTFLLKILTLCAIWGIFAASWDFLSGYTGQVSFGHAIFFGFSAYIAAWISMENSFLIDLIKDLTGQKLLLDPLTAIIFGGLASAILAVIIGFAALRVKGPYLALVTLMVPLIASRLILVFRDLTGGEFGIPFIPQIIEKTSPPNRELDALNFYIFTVLIFFIAIGIMMLIAYSRLGVVFQAIREDEDAAESLGINLAFYKILAFAISAFFAGVAGCMYAQSKAFTGPSYFETSFSFTIIIMCVIGGVGSITGGVIGAFALTILLQIVLEEVFRGVHGLDIFAFGLLLIVSLRYIPFGLSRAQKEQKKAVVIGILFAIFWSILSFADLAALINTPSFENILTIIGLVAMLIFTIPAIPVFIISEIIGLFLLEALLGLGLSAAGLVKAKFLIYATIGIPFAFYLPKIFKRLRLHFWGVWPSVGRYEPD